MMPAPAQFSTVFSYAFRPFFLLCAAHAAVAIAAWGLYQWGALNWPETLPAYIRHGHEMVFGFAGAAIAGFLLTAVATWTLRPAVSGGPLVALCVFWIAARLAAFVPGNVGFMIWGAASVLFWALVSGLMARELLAIGNVRNYKVLPLLLAFVLIEIVFFAAAPDDREILEICVRAGIFLVIGMISLVGGRIIPSFTQNWLKLKRPQVDVQLPTFGPYDLASVVVTTVFAVSFILWPTATVSGALGLLAGLMQTVRVLRWRGWLAAAEPLLWILHVGYAWIPVGFALLGLAGLGTRAAYDPGIHALTYGAMGTLILGVAARVALGHTGRSLVAFPSMTLAFALLTIGTVLRLLAPLGTVFITGSVILWVGAYVLFLVQYTPILLAPRVNA